MILYYTKQHCHLYFCTRLYRAPIKRKCPFVAAATAMGAVLDAHVLKPVGPVLTVFHLVRAIVVTCHPPPSPETTTHRQYHHIPWSPSNSYNRNPRPCPTHQNKNMTMPPSRTRKSVPRPSSLWTLTQYQTSALVLACPSSKP